MAQAFVLILVGITSALALLLGTRGLGMPLRNLKRAAGRMLECVGVMCGFLLLNLSLGMVGVVLWRSLTGRFVSLYYAADVTLVAFSFLQGLMFQWWRCGAQKELGRPGKGKEGST